VEKREVMQELRALLAEAKAIDNTAISRCSLAT
jgi:hypothetical protein